MSGYLGRYLHLIDSGAANLVSCVQGRQAHALAGHRDDILGRAGRKRAYPRWARIAAAHLDVLRPAEASQRVPRELAAIARATDWPIHHRCWREACLARSFSSTSVLTPASTGCARFRMCAHGHRSTRRVSWSSKSPENYLGLERTRNFASPGGAELDRSRMYTAPARMSLNQWALAGDWTISNQAVVLNKADGRIAYRFHSRDLHLVMGPSRRESPVRFRVSIDGQPPGAAHGIDVDDGGNGTVAEQRMYQLIRQPSPIVDRQFQIEFADRGVEAFAFTFG